ncbi:DUF6398 domain-containing protein [Clostridium paraputrificum]|uniref:DUF6398 domain-containing protein n=1 Tax=Clostridium paraputrificum TaxID=29363 RepID=UPI003D348E82
MQNSHEQLIEKRDEILDIIEKFSTEKLNKEYLETSINLCDKLFNAHGELLLKGRSSSWACGVIHALGTENGLFNKNSKPYMKAGDLYKELGVSSSTGLAKSKEIKALLEAISEESLLILKCGLAENIKAPDNEEISHEIIKYEKFIKAQKLIKEAWEAKNFKKKIKLAEEALEICDYCSDAYIILAKDIKKSNEEKKNILEKALSASLKILGVSSFDSIPEYMWDEVEIEALLGAKYKLASQLWENGERKEAIDHCMEILKHDKQDKLMIRSVLINWLLIENKLDKAYELLERFEKDYLTSIHYSKVILAFKESNVEEAARLLKSANRANPNVIPYIIKQKRIPSELPHIRKFGSEEEAMHYMKNGLVVWNNTEGAVSWIKEIRKSL